jgi:hypothetical protein
VALFRVLVVRVGVVVRGLDPAAGHVGAPSGVGGVGSGGGAGLDPAAGHVGAPSGVVVSGRGGGAGLDPAAGHVGAPSGAGGVGSGWWRGLRSSCWPCRRSLQVLVVRGSGRRSRRSSSRPPRESVRGQRDVTPSGEPSVHAQGR